MEKFIFLGAVAGELSLVRGAKVTVRIVGGVLLEEADGTKCVE